MLLVVSDAVWISGFALVTSLVGLCVPIVMIVLKDRLDRRLREEDRKERREMAANVKKIEVQTNSNTDLLVAQTDKAARAEGKLAERQRADDSQDAKTVALAEVEAARELKQDTVISLIGEPDETIAKDIKDGNIEIKNAIKEINR